jgi:hypothetical protein
MVWLNEGQVPVELSELARLNLHFKDTVGWKISQIKTKLDRDDKEKRLKKEEQEAIHRQ